MTSATTKQAQEQRELARMFPATRRDAIDKLSSLGLGKLRELQEQTLLDAMAHDAMRGAYTTNRATQLYQLHDIIGTIIDYRETMHR
jgi:hypothetical protein